MEKSLLQERFDIDFAALDSPVQKRRQCCGGTRLVPVRSENPSKAEENGVNAV